jgi:hypothetical protein
MVTSFIDRCSSLSSDSMLAEDREAHLPIESSAKVVAELMTHIVLNDGQDEIC